VITLLLKEPLCKIMFSFVEGILQASELGQLQLYRVTSADFLETWKLRKKFQDKPAISFTDLTSMVIMKKQGIQRVLTQDEHFLQVGLGLVKLP
jgi:predicted nucleic acid-binding protein